MLNTKYQIPNTISRIPKRLRLWITKTRRRKSLISLLALLILITGIRLIFLNPSDIEAAWSPTHNSWAKRKRLTITNDSTDSLASGTAIAVSIDTKELYQLGKVQEDCDDIRIVHQPDSSTYTNLDRYLSVPGSVNCGTNGATKVYFQLQAALAASASSTNYYMYYDNDKASAPANSDNAFDIGSKDALLVCPFDGSTTCAAAETPSTETGAIRYAGAKTALSFDAHNDCLDDDSNMTLAGLEQFAIEYWMKSDALNSKNDGRIFTLGSAWLDNTVPQNRYQFNVQIGGTWYYFGSGTDSRPNGSDWHHYAVTYDGDALRWFIDGVNTATNTGPNGSVNTGSLGLYMPGSTACTALYRADFDEFRISEVARYTSAFAPQTTPLIRDDYTYALYHFDESGDDPRDTGKTLDDSGNGYDLNITGAKYIAGLVGVDNSSTDEGKTFRQSFAGHEGIFLEEATNNKITNPSFEHGTFDTSWTADSNLWDAENTETDYYKFGSKSARLMTAVEYYSDSNADTDQGLYVSTSDKRLSQSFQVSSGESVSNVSLYLYQTWSNARYLQVEIQTDSSGVPSGTPVSNGTSACSISYYGIPGAADFFDFTFATAPSLSASTQYHIVLIKYTDSGCSTEETSANSFNHVDWLYDGSFSSYSNGDRATMNESSVWSTQSGEDHIFVISDDTDVNYTSSINPGNTNTHTLSAYAYNGVYDSQGELGVNIDSTVAQLVFGASAQTTTYTDMGNGWWRLSYTGTPPAGSSTYGVQVKAGKTIYFDGVQLEELSYSTTYTDGTLGTGYSWSGTAHESTSTRSSADLEYANSGNIDVSSGTLSLWLKPNHPNTDFPNGLEVSIFHWYQNSTNYYDLDYVATTDSFRFRKRITASAYNVNVNKTFSAKEWIHLVATWSTTNGISLTVNNGTPTTDSNTTAPTITTADIDIGKDQSNSYYSNATISDLRILDNELTSAEIADLYQAGLVAHSEQYEVDRFSGEKGQDPVAVWHFDESYGSTANDSSKYGNDLTLYNSPTWNTDSVGAKARLLRNLEFDGSDDIVSRSADLDFNFGTGSFSISGWFRHPSSISGTDTILARYQDAGYKVYMNSSGYICAAIDDDSTWTPDDETCSTSTQGSYADSKWHHFEMVKDEDTSLTLYIDAQRVNYDDTIAATGSLNSNSGLFIGADSNNSNYWTGFLDEIVIYPYARTADQVKADVFGSQASALFGAETKDWLSDGLVGYWKMDESTADSCTGGSNDSCDSSGNSFDLAWTNQATTTAGKFGPGTTYDGTNDYGACTDANCGGIGNLDFGPTPAISWGGWVKSSTSATQMIAGKKESTILTQAGYLAYLNSSGFASCKLGDTTGDAVANATNAINDGTWHHVFCVSDGNTLWTFEDGVPVASNDATPYTAGTLNNTQDFRVGTTGSGTNDLAGDVDEVRVYNRTFTPSEVADLYQWAPGPVGYWNFDEGTGITAYDKTGNGDHGTLQDNASWSNGKFGKAIDLDGTDDYVSVPHSSNLNFGATTDSYTVSSWVYLRDISTNPHIIQKGQDGWGTGEASIMMYHYSPSNEMTCEISDGTTSPYTGDSDTVVTANTWNHVTCVRDVATDTLRIYLNGVLADEDTDTTTGSVQRSDLGLAFGTQPGSLTNDMNGLTDEVRIYNYARTPQQIVEDMNAGHPAPGSPIGSPISHWKLDEMYGTTANDQSSNNNDLTLSSASWSSSGKFNGAFNGGDNLRLTGTDDTDFEPGASTGFAVSAWVKSDGATTAATEYVVSKGGSGVGGYQIYFNTSGQIVCAIDDDATSWPEDSATTTTDYYDQAWHHIVCTRDITADDLYLYVDGEKVANDGNLSATGSLANGSIFYLNDTNATNDTDEFLGDLDEVKYYNFALTAGQVKVLLNQGAAQVMGASGTDSSGGASWSSDRSYCPPGDTTSSCASGLTQHLKLDENTGSINAFDSSSNGRGGILSGLEGPYWVQGKYGSALDFDGSSEYIIGTGTEFPTDNVGSVMMWVKSDSPSALDGFFSTEDGGKDKVGYIESGTFKMGVYDGAAWRTRSGGTVDTNWHHVAFTFDGALGDAWLYVDSMLVDSDDGTSWTGGTGSATTYGRQYFTYGGLTAAYWDGAIDDIRVYDYVRTPAQIAWEYNRGRPVGWWKLDECSGTVANDSGSGSNNGTITPGDATGDNDSAGTCNSGATAPADEMWDEGTNGKRNASLDFDGTNDYVNAGNNSSLSISSSITLSAWVNWSTAPSTRNQTVMEKGASGDGNYYMWWNYNDLTPNTSLVCGFHRSGGGSSDHIYDWSPPADEWYQITCVFDDTNNLYKIYIDGIEVLSEAETYTPVTNSGNLHIGASPLWSGQEFDGQIDEVKIWNYPLTPQQIRNDFNQGAVYFGPNTGSP